MKTKTVMDQMNAEKPDDVLADLEGKREAAGFSKKFSAAAWRTNNGTFLLVEAKLTVRGPVSQNLAQELGTMHIFTEELGVMLDAIERRLADFT